MYVVGLVVAFAFGIVGWLVAWVVKLFHMSCVVGGWLVVRVMCMV